MTAPAAEAAAASAAPATAGRAAAASRAPAPRAGRQGPQGPQGPQGVAQQARDIRRKAPTTPASRTNYQPVVLMEFVAAMVLVAATPVATGKDKAGLSPYAGKDMVKLVALLLVYLILALMTMGGRGAGRIAAWFGGLILIATGLNEAASVAKVLNVFGAGNPPAPGQPGPPEQPGPPPQAV